MSNAKNLLAMGLIGGAPLLGCAPPHAPKAAAGVLQGQVGAVLDDWHDAAARADLGRYFGHLAADSVFLGTDAGERWSKEAFLAYARPHFAKGKAWSFKARRRAVTLAPGGEMAWFDEDLETLGLGPARGSGVLARRGGEWVILHYSLTITVPNERFEITKEAAGAAAVLTPEASDPTARLGWLSGAWVGTTPSGEVTEESWLPPAGGTMVGMGRSRKGGKVMFFELLRVVAREGKLVYLAQPNGKPPTEFVEASSGAGEIAFENKAHDWPKRISYRRVPEGLRARVEGDPGQPVEEWTMKPAVVERGSEKR